MHSDEEILPEEQSTRTRALSTLCAGPFLMLGNFLVDTAPVYGQSREAESFDPRAHATWVPKHSLKFTLLCVPSADGKDT
eukprot:1218593-Rhodomonas_salina.1